MTHDVQGNELGRPLVDVRPVEEAETRGLKVKSWDSASLTKQINS
jgi:hypothetical protein